MSSLAMMSGGGQPALRPISTFKTSAPTFACIQPSTAPCSMQVASRLRVAVAGAGSTGLGLATLLRKRGHDVSVYGKSPPDPPPLPPHVSLPPSPHIPSFFIHPPMSLSALQRNLPWRSHWAVAYCCSPLVRLHGCLFDVLTLRPGLAVLAHIGADEDIMKLGAKVRHLDGRTVDGRCVFDLNYDILEKRAHGLGVHRAALFKGERSASSAAFRAMNILLFTITPSLSHCALLPPSHPHSQFSLTMLQLPAPASTHHSMSPPQPNTQTTPSASAPCAVKAMGPLIWWWTAAEGTADWSTQPPKMLRRMSRIRTRRCGGCANRRHDLARKPKPLDTGV